jgi:hypothetical protein
MDIIDEYGNITFGNLVYCLQMRLSFAADRLPLITQVVSRADRSQQPENPGQERERE